jgi:hypothetical protein
MPEFGAGSMRFMFIALGCGAAYFGWSAIWGGMFRATDIQVIGVGKHAEESIRAGLAEHTDSALLGILPRANLLFLSRDGATEAISEKIALERVEVRKRLPHGVTVDAAEKTGRAALDMNGRLFALEESGHIIRELSASETDLLGTLPPGMAAVAAEGLGAEVIEMPTSDSNIAGEKDDSVTDISTRRSGLPLIRNSAATVGDDSPAPGGAGVNAAAMRIILQAATRLPDVISDDISWFVVEPSSETVEAVTVSGWKVLMSSALPFDTQSDRLSIVLKEKIGAKRDTLEYVDLRYNERIFIRYEDGSTQ